MKEQSVDIDGDINRVWELASDVPRWPEMLPHYRYVTVLDEAGPRRTIVMAARRGRLPIKWTSILELVPNEHRILFRHIGGPARGMAVEWRIVQHDGFVRVTIAHDLGQLAYGIVRGRLGRYVLAEHFIAPVAGRTLGRFKELVEAETKAAVAAVAG